MDSKHFRIKPKTLTFITLKTYSLPPKNNKQIYRLLQYTQTWKREREGQRHLGERLIHPYLREKERKSDAHTIWNQEKGMKNERGKKLYSIFFFFSSFFLRSPQKVCRKEILIYCCLLSIMIKFIYHWFFFIFPFFSLFSIWNGKQKLQKVDIQNFFSVNFF